jgi:ABC-2 type transport system ATP-binding protein
MSSFIGSDARPSEVRGHGDAPIIQMDGVSVLYRVPHDRIGSFKEYAIRRLKGRAPDRHDLWALRDVDLVVRTGEAFGIVGRNGAGKSTLLKVISGVMRPTRGRIRVWGRVTPVLNLGAGLHPELTGTENAFLNGTMLGRSKREVAQKLDEITEFAELEEFMDAPLRTYSQGMIARLSFAIATAWEADVLVLDEVLAVGDEAFQQKCHDRLSAARKRGVTVVLVSHSLEVVRRLCHRAIWLERGEASFVGSPGQAIDRYLGHGSQTGAARSASLT